MTSASSKGNKPGCCHQGRLHWSHWLILSLSLLITLFAWKTSHTALTQEEQARFDREAERAVYQMRERITHYEDALHAGVAAMQSHDGEMSREQWRRYYDFLQLNKRYPGINGIGIIKLVEKRDIPEFLSEVRATYPDFTLFPEHSFDLSLPVTYIEPFAQNSGALGLDAAFESTRRSAALYARSTGTTQISGPIVLVQDKAQTPGFLFYAPYYNGESMHTEQWDAKRREQNFRGLVYAPLSVRNLVEGVLGRENPLVSISIYDKDFALYQTDTHTRQDEPAFKHVEYLPMHGRIWRYEIASTPAFEKSAVFDQPAFVLLSGICLGIMLFVLFLVMTRSNRQILNMAEEMTDNLSAQARQLSENNRDLESFAHIVSHDLKTPIRNIHSLTQILEEDLADYIASNDDQMEIQERLDGLRDQAMRSQNLIAGILEYSVQDGNDAPKTTVDTRQLVKSIGEQLDLPPDKFKLYGDFPRLETNKTRLEQVLTNLAENAIKYNPDKQTAKIEITAALEGDYYRFSVSDNGPGIDPRYHQRIFEPFTTLESVTDIHSSGIGLSIVQRSVERQGGHVEVESNAGSGTTFHFTWPIRDEYLAPEATLKRA